MLAAVLCRRRVLFTFTHLSNTLIKPETLPAILTVIAISTPTFQRKHLGIYLFSFEIFKERRKADLGFGQEESWNYVDVSILRI